MGHLKKIYLGLIIFVLLLPYSSHAKHIIGGEITYELIDTINYVYNVTIKVYRDCSPGNIPYDDPLCLVIFDNVSPPRTEGIAFPGAVELPFIDVNDTCLKVPEDICVEEAIYVQNNITLPPGTGGYHLTYQRCCRNNAILNITSPGTTGATYTAFIPDTGVAKYNSNPAFNNFPPILICVDKPLDFDHAATDIDGDSLVYELCTPYKGATLATPKPCGLIGESPAPPPPPYLPVIWKPPYTQNAPLGGVPSLDIDPITGFLTGTPNTIGEFVVGVCVKEYRNGVFLSENKRDFQFNVTTCSNPTAAIADDVMAFCGNRTVTFPNNSQSAFAYEWDFGDPSTTTDTSTAEFPTYTYSDTGTYIVRLIVNPGTLCVDTAYLTVIIKSGIYANFYYIKGCVNVPISFFDSTIIDTGFIVNWFWDFGDGGASNAENPTHLYGLPGVYNVTLIVLSDLGCLDTINKLVTVYPLPVFGLGCDTIICFGESLDYNWKPGPIYTWTPDSGLVTNNGSNMPIISPKNDITTYHVQAIDANGCKYNDTITIGVQPAPSVDAGPDDTIDRGVNYPLQGSGSSGIIFEWADSCLLSGITTSASPVTFEWSPEDSLNDITIANPQTIPLFLTTTFYLKVTDQFGCISIDSVTIYVRLEPIMEIPTAFTPNGDEKNDVFKLFYYDIENLLYFRIFNRWGEKLFETTNLDEGWDGKYKGKPQEVGSYVYVAVGESMVDGKKVMTEKKGMVALVR